MKSNIQYRVRVNERIIVPQVRVVDAEGKMLGVMPTAEALALALAQGMDLIEVSPKAVPPVVKILSFDKYRYQLEKAERQQKKKLKQIQVKGIRLSVRIGEHDLKFKVGQAEKFLSQGNKVKIELMLRGRERANVGYAREVIDKFLKTVSASFVVEQGAKQLGRFITTVIAPKA